MNSTTLPSLICATSLSVLGGCASLAPNQQASTYSTQVKPVMTEYSQALHCVGQLIDSSDAKPLTVYVRDIDDETVPTRYRHRRLSRGGAWWFHTAIDKMRSDKVTSIVKLPPKKQRASANILVLRGAWTQDDQKVGVNEKSVGFKNADGGWIDRLGWFSEQHISVIAGDFVSTKSNQVMHASAISLAVNNSDNSYELRIDDGSRRLNLGLTNDVNEGPQFAQRRIAEAAALVHVARAFQIDYRSCVEQGWSNPSTYTTQMREYATATHEQQYQKMQRALSAAGYYEGNIDGVWGSQSAQALMLFLTEQGAAPVGQPSAEHFAMLIKHHDEQPHDK